MSTVCPLCLHPALALFHRDQRREYWQCSRCALVSVPTSFHLTAAQEKAVYDLHRNDPQDAGYRRFLARLSEPLVALLPAQAQGLDFGCGPGPTLSIMLAEHGYPTQDYDPIYQPDASLLTRQYDFICATEVVEHLRQPAQVFDHLYRMLHPGGILAIMTKRVRDQQAFQHWHYIQDPTHICFFSDRTFSWITQRWPFVICHQSADVMILQKQLKS